jgi:hypothetical protein
MTDKTIVPSDEIAIEPMQLRLREVILVKPRQTDKDKR